MAPHAEDTPFSSDSSPSRITSPHPVRVLIIGAGSRGYQYSRCVSLSHNGIVSCVAEPIPYKRQRLGSNYIWGSSSPSEGQSFSTWQEFLTYELSRREREKNGEHVPKGVHAVFICVLDEMHKEVIVGLAPLGLHVMCEKPLATRMQDCVDIWRALLPASAEGEGNIGKLDRIFSIGHVLRYSAHNMLLRKLLLEEKVIGDILSVNHTEPVGWWHFTHAYVRGNWRKESTTAPSLLTKSCHDIDLLLWLLCSPPPTSPLSEPHLPTTITSIGSLQNFTSSRKPPGASTATNCLSCPIEPDCKYSAKNIYLNVTHRAFKTRDFNCDWPLDVLVPDIEDIFTNSGMASAEKAILSVLAEDYTSSTPISEIESKKWFGRCVYESDNDVLDDQFVTLSFEADAQKGRKAKQAVFHMVAQTKKICERYTHIYGTEGEIYADSEKITVEDFRSGEKREWNPKVDVSSGHGGGDKGLVEQFLGAVEGVLAGGDVGSCQREWVGCDLEEVIRSHAVVFAAEEARKNKVVLDFEGWWDREVVRKLRG